MRAWKCRASTGSQHARLAVRLRPLNGKAYRLRLVTGIVKLRPELKEERKIYISGDKREGSVGMTEEDEM